MYMSEFQRNADAEKLSSGTTVTRCWEAPTSCGWEGPLENLSLKISGVRYHSRIFIGAH